MFGVVRGNQSTICRDQFCRAQVVATKPKLSVQPADAAAKGEAGDAGHGNDWAGASQAESLVDLVELRPGKPGVRHGPLLIGTHGHGAHTRQIQEDSAVGGGKAGGMVPTAFHRDLEVVFARKPDSRDDITSGFTPNEGAGTPIVQPVPNLAGRFIVGIRRCNQRTAETAAELVKRKITQDGAPPGYDPSRAARTAPRSARPHRTKTIND